MGESDFEKASYPAPFPPSEASVFARFLYKAAEQKNALDAISKDFATIEAATKKLPVFWERTVEVDKVAEFKGLNPATVFTMQWMQANGMLGDLSAVRSTYETFVNAKKNRVVANIYLPGPEKDHAASVKEAKEIAKQIHSANAKYSKHALEFNIVVDKEFAKGFAEEAAGAKKVDIDYTAMPPHTPIKTQWDEN